MSRGSRKNAPPSVDLEASVIGAIDTYFSKYGDYGYGDFGGYSNRGYVSPHSSASTGDPGDASQFVSTTPDVKETVPEVSVETPSASSFKTPTPTTTSEKVTYASQAETNVPVAAAPKIESTPAPPPVSAPISNEPYADPDVGSVYVKPYEPPVTYASQAETNVPVSSTSTAPASSAINYYDNDPVPSDVSGTDPTDVNVPVDTTQNWNDADYGYGGGDVYDPTSYANVIGTDPTDFGDTGWNDADYGYGGGGGGMDFPNSTVDPTNPMSTFVTPSNDASQNVDVGGNEYPGSDIVGIDPTDIQHTYKDPYASAWGSGSNHDTGNTNPSGSGGGNADQTTANLLGSGSETPTVSNEPFADPGVEVDQQNVSGGGDGGGGFLSGVGNVVSNVTGTVTGAYDAGKDIASDVGGAVWGGVQGGAGYVSDKWDQAVAIVTPQSTSDMIDCSCPTSAQCNGNHESDSIKEITGYLERYG